MVISTPGRHCNKPTFSCFLIFFFCRNHQVYQVWPSKACESVGFIKNSIAEHEFMVFHCICNSQNKHIKPFQYKSMKTSVHVFCFTIRIICKYDCTSQSKIERQLYKGPKDWSCKPTLNTRMYSMWCLILCMSISNCTKVNHKVVFQDTFWF